MIQRILEPEVMDSAEEARDYDSMNHRDVNSRYVEDFLMAASTACLPPDARILDLGTGTALIPIEIARRLPRVQITAIDLAEEMLKLGRQNVEQAGLADRVTLEFADAKRLPKAAGHFDAVICNSIIHHIPEPLSVFRTMRDACRAPGLLFIRDLLRPDSESGLARLVDLHAADGSARQRQLFRDSLHAALTIGEVARLLHDAGLPADAVRQTSDRHWTVSWIRSP